MGKNDYYMVQTIGGSHLNSNDSAYIAHKNFSNEKKAKEYFEKEKSTKKNFNIYLEKRNKVYPHKTERVDFYNGDK